MVGYSPTRVIVVVAAGTRKLKFSCWKWGQIILISYYICDRSLGSYCSHRALTRIQKMSSGPSMMGWERGVEHLAPGGLYNPSFLRERTKQWRPHHRCDGWDSLESSLRPRRDPKSMGYSLDRFHVTTNFPQITAVTSRATSGTVPCPSVPAKHGSSLSNKAYGSHLDNEYYMFFQMSHP